MSLGDGGELGKCQRLVHVRTHYRSWATRIKKVGEGWQVDLRDKPPHIQSLPESGKQR